MSYLKNNKNTILSVLLIFFLIIVVLMTLFILLYSYGFGGSNIRNMGIFSVIGGAISIAIGTSFIFIIPFVALVMIILIILHGISFVYRSTNKKIETAETRYNTPLQVPQQKTDKHLFIAIGIVIFAVIAYMAYYTFLPFYSQEQKVMQLPAVSKIFTKKFDFSQPILIAQPQFVKDLQIKNNLIMLDETDTNQVATIKFDQNTGIGNFSTVNADTSYSPGIPLILDGKIYWSNGTNTFQYDPSSKKVILLPDLKNVLVVTGIEKENLIVNINNEQGESVANYNLSTHNMTPLNLQTDNNNFSYVINGNYLCFPTAEYGNAQDRNTVTLLNLTTKKTENITLDTDEIDIIPYCDNKKIIWITTDGDYTNMGVFNISKGISLFTHTPDETAYDFRLDGNKIYYSYNDKNTDLGKANRINTIDLQTGQEYPIVSIKRNASLENWDVSNGYIVYEITKNNKNELYLEKIPVTINPISIVNK